MILLPPSPIAFKGQAFKRPYNCVLKLANITDQPRLSPRVPSPLEKTVGYAFVANCNSRIAPAHAPRICDCPSPFIRGNAFFGFQRETYFYRREKDVLLIVKSVT